MATPVTMPMLGLTMEEGTVAEWLKREGDPVTKDEPLLTVEMDKGTVEVPAPAAGILRRILVQPGTTVAIKTLIAEIGEPGEMLTPTPAPSAERAASTSAAPISSPTSAGAVGSGTVAHGAGSNGTPAIGGPARSAALAQGSGRLFASPRARMRARTLGVDLGAIRGSGPHGRIVEADVLAQPSEAEDPLREPQTEADSRVRATPLARRLAQEHGVEIGELQGTGPGGRVTQDDVLRAAEQRAPAAERRAPAVPAAPAEQAVARGDTQPLSRLRRITAERMATSAQTTARVTLYLDADFSEAARFRDQLQPEFVRLGVAKLPWDALIARAAGLALLESRALLAQWVDGQGLRPGAAAHVGVAVALEPEGLVVPVLHDAGTRSLRELAADLLSLVDKARAGRLSPAEMHGGAFTITNLGAYRIDGFTPLINPPETAILGVGRIYEKPVVVEGKVGIATMCTLSLSFDHRVVDGATAAAFLARLAELLERPYTLLGI